MRMKLLFLAVVAAFVLGGALPMILSWSASAQSGGSAIIVSTQGTLNAGGQYAQSMGTFFRVVQGSPTPTPTPSPTPCQPTPGTPGSTFYFGTYTLSNSESGNFFLSVQNGDNAATGGAVPQSAPTNPVIVEQGNATVALQINTAAMPVTGSGTISFTSNGSAITGNIMITSKFVFPPTDPVPCGTPTPTPTVTPTPTPTPTSAQITGRIFTPSNVGLKSANVALLTPSGSRIASALSNSFGVYTFNNVPTGAAYIINVSSKRYRFSQQFIFLDGNMSNVNFVGVE